MNYTMALAITMQHRAITMALQNFRTTTFQPILYFFWIDAHVLFSQSILGCIVTCCFFIVQLCCRSRDKKSSVRTNLFEWIIWIFELAFTIYFFLASEKIINELEESVSCVNISQLCGQHHIDFLSIWNVSRMPKNIHYTAFFTSNLW